MTDAASILFGNPSPPAQAAPQPAPIPEAPAVQPDPVADGTEVPDATPEPPVDPVAEPTFDELAARPVDVPESIKALRSSVERTMYPSVDKPLADAVSNAFSTLHVEHPQLAQTIGNEVAQMAKDAGFTPAEFAEVARTVNAVRAQPPSEAQAAQWRQQAMLRLRSEFGDAAPEAMRAAKALMARDPRVSGFLGHVRAAEHPDLVARFAARGLAERRAGRL